MSFQNLRKNSKNNLEKLKEQVKGNAASYSDDRFWTLSKDKTTGIGAATIRFINDRESNFFFIEKRHQFEHNGVKVNEKCPTSIGLPCPICEENAKLWKGSESDKELARKRNAKRQYISNIYIVNDPEKPEHETTVKLYKFGVKIFDKLKSMITPESKHDEAVDVFDYWTGLDFKLRSKMIQVGTEKMPNYDNSAFAVTNVFNGWTDEQIEKVYNQTYLLSEFEKVDGYKSYDELSALLNKTKGINTSNVQHDELPAPSSKSVSSNTGNTKSSSTEVDSSDQETDDLLNEINSLMDS